MIALSGAVHCRLILSCGGLKHCGPIGPNKRRSAKAEQPPDAGGNRQDLGQSRPWNADKSWAAMRRSPAVPSQFMLRDSLPIR